MSQDLDSHAGGIARTVIALVVLFIFLAVVGYSYWPDLMPGLLRTVQGLRGTGAEEVESRYFDARRPGHQHCSGARCGQDAGRRL